MEAVIRCAKVEDVNKLVDFLEKANLATEGVENSIEYFLILEDEVGNIQATLGIEPLDQVGLLRSFAITANATERELLLIFEQMLMLARDKQLQSLYLATNKRASMPFFHMLGFKEVTKDQLDVNIYSSNHIKNILTVDNSVFMQLKLK